MPAIRIGTSGWCMRHADYYRTFAATELQQTFYQPPLLKTAQRWRQQAGPDFEFCLKAFQAITHTAKSPTFRRCKLPPIEREQCGAFRDTPVVRAAWQTTAAFARALRATWIIFQCPASFTPTDDNIANLRRFFGWAQREQFRFGWEPRGPAWTDALVGDLCRELDLVHVVDPFVRPPVHGSPRYFRLHGIGGYRYRYSDAELAHIAGLCTADLTYVMFNNTEMCPDALRFSGLVGGAAESRRRNALNGGSAVQTAS